MTQTSHPIGRLEVSVTCFMLRKQEQTSAGSSRRPINYSNQVSVRLLEVNLTSSELRVVNNLISQCCYGECAGIALNDTHNDTKDTQSGSENLHNQNLDKQGCILSITNGTTGSCNTN